MEGKKVKKQNNIEMLNVLGGLGGLRLLLDLLELVLKLLDSLLKHYDTLDGVFETDTTAHWLEKLQGVLPAAPVYDLAQALDNPFPIANGMIRTTPHPLRADFRSFANPIKLDGKRLPAASGPALGADTEAVLGDLGYTAEELAALRASGIT